MALSANFSPEVMHKRLHDPVTNVLIEETVFESEDGVFRYGEVKRYIIDESKTAMTAQRYVEEHFANEEEDVFEEWRRDEVL